MAILSFAFEDTRLSWSVAPFTLDGFNLLVGRSGAGKTRILNALYAISLAAIGRDTSLYQCAWQVSLDVNGVSYTWAAQTGQRPSGVVPEMPFFDYSDDEDEDDATEDGDERTLAPVFAHERVTMGDQELIARDTTGTRVNASPFPALKTSESVLSLLREEPQVKPLVQAFRRFLFSRATTRSLRQMFDPRRFEKEKRRFKSLDQLRADTRLPLGLKAWIMQEKFPEEFARLEEEFRAIFESVTSVRVAKSEELLTGSEREDANLGAFQFVDFAIHEEGVERPITFGAMSSGMRRTLTHLLELALAPAGSVVLVDEYENSLGVNCLPSLTDHLLKRSGELQFILTSHHPYVIENIDRRYWKVVTRRGGQVRVRSSADFPALDTKSRQSAFILLLDVLERETADGA